MPNQTMRTLAPSVVLLNGNRAAVRRFALRRAAMSAMITVALTFAWDMGMAGSLIFGLFGGAATYIGFAARGTRGLRMTDQDHADPEG